MLLNLTARIIPKVAVAPHGAAEGGASSTPEAAKGGLLKPPRKPPRGILALQNSDSGMPDCLATLFKMPTFIIELRPWYGTVTIRTRPGIWNCRCDPDERTYSNPCLRSTATTCAYVLGFTQTPAP